MLRRRELTDEQSDAIKTLLPGKEGDPGVKAKDDRLLVNASIFCRQDGNSRARFARALRLVAQRLSALQPTRRLQWNHTLRVI
jgi:hypothetical protein